MSDMIDALRTLRQPEEPQPAADTVAADVARGRRALLRRRRRWIAGSSAVAVAAVAAVALGTAGLVPDGRTVQAAPETSAQQNTPVQLAAYTGTQPAGFRVATIPAGWHVSASTAYDFVVAPAGVDTSGPHGAVVFTDAIAVMLQGLSRFAPGAPTTHLTINGQDAQLGLTSDKGSEWLIYPDAAGHHVLIQVPVKFGLTNDQLIRFAQGIAVTSAVLTPGG